MWVTIHRMSGNKTTGEIEIKFHKLMTPVLRYESKTWAIRWQDRQTIQSAEIKVFRKRKGCRLKDHINNEIYELSYVCII